MSENGRRVLALGVSIGLVGLAFFVRGRGDDDGGGSGGDGGGDRLVCTTELEDVCRALADEGDYEVTVEDAATTADRLLAVDRAEDADADLWLAPRPWVEAVEVSRDLAGDRPVTGEASGTIARSPVVLVVQENRADALAGACGGSITWQCVGDAANRPWTNVGGQPNWGTVKAGIADPGAGANLLALAAAVGDRLDDTGFASNDFDGALDNWLAGFAATAPTAGRPAAVGEMITGGPGLLAVLGTVEAQAGPALASDAVRVVVPEPVVTADLVAVPLVDAGDGEDGDPGGAAADLAEDDDLLDALAEAGWRVEGRDAAPGVDTAVELPDEANVPRGDVLWVLLQRWQELV
ncbi:MAG TPA: hypothetical protein VIL36_04945 [Acidimicrobiales bacterium]